ncbi:MAG TPA: two-component regulator propeller domain-containing protein, partial [Saprospiraceae bacterium]|nr:two-component regulator propeller domain-containing protein [Saprospiraceae bacterium]
KTYFLKPGDTTSLPSNHIQTLYTDQKGNLWIGTMAGLCRYEYATDRFIRYAYKSPILINDIREDQHGQFWLATNYGLWSVDEPHHTIAPYTHNQDKDFQKMFYTMIRQIMPSPNGNWYMATTTGIKVFNPYTLAYDEIKTSPNDSFSISSNSVISVAVDSSGYLWATCTAPTNYLNRIDLKNHKVKYYHHFVDPQKNWTGNTINQVFVDHQGRLWVTSGLAGLSLYDPKKDDFTDYLHDPNYPNSLLSNQVIALYQGLDGVIWVGSNGYGLSYFNPEKNLFSTIYPFLYSDGSATDTWCRAACEDHDGHIWLATAKGLAEYDQEWHLLQTFVDDEGKKPMVYSNSVRSLLVDDEGDIWIGTAKGLNRYHPKTGVMDFFDPKQMPLAFFWMMAKDKSGTIWFGTATGLYKYDRKENRFDDLRGDSLLKPYAYRNVQALYIDRHNRMWIGLLDIGLVMYDLNQPQAELLTIKDSLITDTRFSAFAEDHDGKIWFGSEEGLVAYDPEHRKSQFYSRENGLSSNRTNCIMVDSFDRIWIGTSNGLCVLNKERNAVRRFDISDGLLTNHFNEQSAFETNDGIFIYPNYKGFLVFNPGQYVQNHTGVPVYVTSITVSNQLLTPNPKDLQEIRLKPDQNFFNFELTGLHYDNPDEIKYAYQLAPFQKDWVITTRKEINFTNVPAGDYTFRYKAISDNADWNVEEKTIRVHVARIFYKTWWFLSLLGLGLISPVIWFFRYRIRHRESLLELKGKAQLLEKEKTLVMYENLKQHLNPHFLFNSLTSLSSLIRVDQEMASDFLDNMSKVYRYILKNRDNETVPVSEELNFIRMFTQLQQTRFGDALKVNINIDEDTMYRRLAPVTLQNLVENAIKHNIADQDSPLVIDIYAEGEYLVVRNNLQKKHFVETSNQQGLASMQSLYQYLSHRPMLIEDGPDYFTVKIPLI